MPTGYDYEVLKYTKFFNVVYPRAIKWWRRRELNPRPLVRHYWLYMLRVRLLISRPVTRRSGYFLRSRLVLTVQPRARYPRDLAALPSISPSKKRIMDVSGFFRPLVRSFRRLRLFFCGLLKRPAAPLHAPTASLNPVESESAPKFLYSSTNCGLSY